MNHRISQRKLNRTSSHRRAMQRNMAQSLFEHGQIRTTVPKAKDIRPFAERLITLAKRARQGSLIARRRLHKLMGERSYILAEHRSTYEAMSDAGRRHTLAARSGRRYRANSPKGRLEFTGESITHRLINTVAPRYEGRDGGYTRLIKLSTRRVGDRSFLAVVQLVGGEESPGSVTKPAAGSRKRKANSRYAAAVKAAKAFAGAKRGPAKDDNASPEEDT
ncbi:MAG: 50S ribosomal protein L17 [Phycisphaerae bacterium]